MAQKNTEMGTETETDHPAKTLDKILNDSRYKDKIQEWWFDNTLYQEKDPHPVRTELKRYYAFTQIFYHEYFRESNTERDQCLKALIERIEHEDTYRNCQGEEKRLVNLVLGSAYRRLGQFKTERYQSAEAEHDRAIYYLEQDISFFELAEPDKLLLKQTDEGICQEKLLSETTDEGHNQEKLLSETTDEGTGQKKLLSETTDEGTGQEKYLSVTTDEGTAQEEYADRLEDFVIMLLFLLNRAKYFRDIAEKDSLRVDASYWRAIMLFQEIRTKIEALSEARSQSKKEARSKKETHSEAEALEGILARIYASAWLNIAQIYRFRQEYDLAAEECRNLVGFCINSLANPDEKNAVRDVVKKLPQIGDIEQIPDFSVREFMQDGRNKADYLFEDYILQALLQLGISYRDRVDFNGSRVGNFWVRQAMAVFLVLGIVDRIKDYGAKVSTEKITAALKTLQELKWDSMNVPESLIIQIRDICTGASSVGTPECELKNADAQNNLAVCLKKLDYYPASIAVLTDVTLKGNKFAEYNLCKCYLESGLTKEMEHIRNYCHREEQNNTLPAFPVYIYPDEPEKSNHKWLFLYARYLFARQEYENAEKLFSHIRSGRAIQWDSLELKAAYLEAQCQIKREKYLAAITSLQNIHESLLKLDNERSQRRHEIRTEIDLGWCLIVEDRYKEALNVYRDLLAYLIPKEQAHGKGAVTNSSEESPSADETDSPDFLTGGLSATLAQLKTNMASLQSSDSDAAMPQNHIKWHAVSRMAQKRILHNLYDCWTYLHMEDPNAYPAKVSNLIMEICALNEDSDIYMQFLNSLRNMSRLKQTFYQDAQANIDGYVDSSLPDGGDSACHMRSQWVTLSDGFRNILKSRPMDYLTYSCWVISKVNCCMQFPFSKEDTAFQKQKKQLLLGLVSSTTPITMKSYIEIARIILAGDGNFLAICKETKNDHGLELERAFLELFCHVRLLENGTNQAFMKLMTNESFHSIELVTRAKLLAGIVDLYGDILRVKTQLRVTYAELESFDAREPYADFNPLDSRERPADLKSLEDRKQPADPKVPENKEQRSSAGKNAKPIICQYTRLSTLKNLLPRTAEVSKAESAQQEPRFRMSNAARMNDASEGATFKKICEYIPRLHPASDESALHSCLAAGGSGTSDVPQASVNPQTPDKPRTYDEVIKKYIDNSAGYKDVDDLSSFDSDVYIASFSLNQNNFGLWSNYADKEKGCIIGFDQSFFDLVDKNYYSILDDEVEENALYRIVYVDERQLLAGNEDQMFKSFKTDDQNETRKMDVQTIITCIPNILQKLEKIEKMLTSQDNQIKPEAAGVVRAFIVDRLNEIRFLFKSVSYEYEEEVRLLRCSQNPEVDNTGSSPVPWLYINVEKKLDNLTLILGSKVDLFQVRELSVWAKSTGRVKQVLWSGLNRL